MIPPTTKPIETNASESKCRKALFTLMSLSLSLKNINAETPLINIPMAAIIEMVSPGIGWGYLNLNIASYPIAPIESNSTTAFKSEIKMDAFLYP